MKKSYKGFMVWLILFCVGVLAIIFMDIKNIDLVGLVLGNYMFGQLVTCIIRLL